jgi:alpha-tubulin suppressor-like RCC1 family protein
LVLRGSTSYGKPYDIGLACGWNDQGQLGIGRTDETKVPYLRKVVFEGIPFEDEILINTVSCGWNHTLLVLNNGKLFVTGSNEYGQLGLGFISFVDRMKEVEFFRLQKLFVIKVSAGLRHSLALTSNGKLYVWGDNKFGQLGLDTQSDSSLQKKYIIFMPRCILLNSLNIEDISTGQRHSLILLSNGDLMATGDNRFGQLGCDRNKITSSYHWIFIEQKEKIKWRQIYSGWTHNIGIDVEGKVWTWGRNHLGQLGQNYHVKVYEDQPHQIDGLKSVKQVSYYGPFMNLIFKIDYVLMKGKSGFGTYSHS